MSKPVETEESIGKGRYMVQWGPCTVFLIKPTQSAMRQLYARFTQAFTRASQAAQSKKSMLSGQQTPPTPPEKQPRWSFFPIMPFLRVGVP
jgi:hypothetical protein